MVWVNARNEALRLLLESNITNDLKDYAMNDRIADIIEGIIKKHNLMESVRISSLKSEESYLKRIHDAILVLEGTETIDKCRDES